jgi:SAM-dependent methyltransferase
MAITVDKWFEGVNYEVGFWQNYLTAKGGARWSDDFRNRFDPNRPFNSAVEEAIRDTRSRQIDLLDVGSGPVTSLGYVSKKFEIRITATDPLADAYSILLDEAGVAAPVKTQRCFGENLLEHFGSRRFHVCHSCNALDHSMDPRTILRAMAELLHPQGLMYVRVHRNEGESTGYSGLHNWNFDRDENNNFILWRGTERYNINEDLSHFVAGQVDELVDEEGPELVFIGYRKAPLEEARSRT